MNEFSIAKFYSIRIGKYSRKLKMCWVLVLQFVFKLEMWFHDHFSFKLVCFLVLLLEMLKFLCVFGIYLDIFRKSTYNEFAV